MKESLSISFVPGECKILGVFGNQIHLIGFIPSKPDYDSECIIIMSKMKYLKAFNLWLEGKKRHCESYSAYCGVYGALDAIKFVEVDGIILNKFNEETEECDKVLTRAFYVTEFDDWCQFEHG